MANTQSSKVHLLLDQTFDKVEFSLIQDFQSEDCDKVVFEMQLQLVCEHAQVEKYQMIPMLDCFHRKIAHKYHHAPPEITI